MTAAICETSDQRAARLLRQAEAQKRYLAKRRAEGKPIIQNRYNKDKQRRANLRKYGLTPESAQALLEAQGCKCVICQRDIAFLEHANSLGDNSACVDHCHVGGQTRGILCRKCNSGLGMFFDNPAWLREAANYLENNDGT